ncbi:MAG: hypothetical protein A2X25_13115 [Chloroflexi bacterium GWB2_49_20]|nr:MAG: hypothetical protein A2X25_13115 [Chloroflexi bacterium GWB2_49_20]OGN78347.1 MAG: hypothetical protein A2X26_01085 [Chloroflexi bacterium GWC2_49_37]OGN84189.1 MAG: hypothetical protein A2X27_14605 [Chloroflexi bacterium GWD2_49_16]HBG75151.1 hypothetical protein [Anaerolineae bacterium]HCC79213.1 hypothetical protein [Anaerolineae bacterium]
MSTEQNKTISDPLLDPRKMNMVQRPWARGTIVAIIGAIASAYILTLLPKPFARDILVALVGYFGGVYMGLGLSTDSAKKAALEYAVSGAFFGLSLAGLWLSPWFLALACFAHAAWDAAHHPKALDIFVRPWYVPTCVVYDILMGTFVLLWWWR